MRRARYRRWTQPSLPLRPSTADPAQGPQTAIWEACACEPSIPTRHIRLCRPLALPARCPHSLLLTAFDCQGVFAARRERVEPAVEAAGQHVAQPYESWIAADSSRGGVRVLITGPHGFEGPVAFARDEAPKRIVSPAARPHGRRAEETLGGSAESQGSGGGTSTRESRQRKRRLIPEGGRRGGRPKRLRRPRRPNRERSALFKQAPPRIPGRRAGCGDGGGTCERAGRCHGIAGAASAASRHRAEDCGGPRAHPAGAHEARLVFRGGEDRTQAVPCVGR